MCRSQASLEAARNTLFFLRGCIRGCQLLPQHPCVTMWESASGRANAVVAEAHELSCKVHQEAHQQLRWLLSSRDLRLFKLPLSLAKPSQLYPLLLPALPGLVIQLQVKWGLLSQRWNAPYLVSVHLEALTLTYFHLVLCAHPGFQVCM